METTPSFARTLLCGYTFDLGSGHETFLSTTGCTGVQSLSVLVAPLLPQQGLHTFVWNIPVYPIQTLIFDSRPQLLTGMRCFVSCTLLPWPLLLSYLLTLGGPASCHGCVAFAWIHPPVCYVQPVLLAGGHGRYLFVVCSGASPLCLKMLAE